jgi:hypothetical protein
VEVTIKVTSFFYSNLYFRCKVNLVDNYMDKGLLEMLTVSVKPYW